MQNIITLLNRQGFVSSYPNMHKAYDALGYEFIRYKTGKAIRKYKFYYDELELQNRGIRLYVNMYAEYILQNEFGEILKVTDFDRVMGKPKEKEQYWRPYAEFDFQKAMRNYRGSKKYKTLKQKGFHDDSLEPKIRSIKSKINLQNYGERQMPRKMERNWKNYRNTQYKLN